MSYLDDIAQEVASELDPSDLPKTGDLDDLLRSYAVLVRTKGLAAEAADVHDAWAAWMAKVDPNHPALKPYHDLDPETQREDAPFLIAIHAVAARRAE